MRGITFWLASALVVIGVGLLSCSESTQMYQGRPQVSDPTEQLRVLRLEEGLPGSNSYQLGQLKQTWLKKLGQEKQAFTQIRVRYDYTVETSPITTFLYTELSRHQPENDPYDVAVRIAKDKDGTEQLALFIKPSLGHDYQRYDFRDKIDDLYGQTLSSTDSAALFEHRELNQRQLVKAIIQNGNPSAVVLWRYFVNEPDAATKTEAQLNSLPPLETSTSSVSLSVLTELLIVPFESANNGGASLPPAGQGPYGPSPRTPAPGMRRLTPPAHRTATKAETSENASEEANLNEGEDDNAN